MNQTQTSIEIYVLVEQNIKQYENIYYNRDDYHQQPIMYYMTDEMFSDRIPF